MKIEFSVSRSFAIVHLNLVEPVARLRPNIGALADNRRLGYFSWHDIVHFVGSMLRSVVGGKRPNHIAQIVGPMRQQSTVAGMHPYCIAQLADLIVQLTVACK